MKSTDTRLLFSRLVENEPPVPDVGPFIDAAHAAGRRRRWGYTGASGLAVAAVVGATVAVPTLLPDPVARPAQVSANGSAAKSPVASKPPDEIPVYPQSAETSARAVGRLTAALKSVINLPPDARLIAVPFVPSRPDLKPLEFYPSQGGYKAIADIADRAGTSNVFLDVGNSVGTPLLEDGCPLPAHNNPTCTSYRTKASDRVIVNRQVEPSGVILLSVSAARLDGGYVYVACRNYGENGIPSVPNRPDPKPQRTTPICTESQLVAVVLAPALSFYPPGWLPMSPQPPGSPSRIGCPPGTAECPLPSPSA